MVDERSSMEDGVVEESREKREMNRLEREKETRSFDTRPIGYVCYIPKTSDVPCLIR